jgi:hypothetical protein
MRTRPLLRYSLAALAVVAATAAFSTAGHAVTFDLTSDHCLGGCGTAPFGTVDVTQVGANVHIVVDLAKRPTEYRFMGAGGGRGLPALQIQRYERCSRGHQRRSDVCGTNVAGKHWNLQRARHRAFQFRDQLHHLRERGSWDL